MFVTQFNRFGALGVRLASTREMPARYVAFDNPGVLVISEAAYHLETCDCGEQHSGSSLERICPQRGGFEFAVFYEPAQNLVFETLTDGIYCEVGSYQGEQLQVECLVTTPDRNRQQRVARHQCFTMHEALAFIARWLPEAREVVTEAVRLNDITERVYQSQRQNATQPARRTIAAS